MVGIPAFQPEHFGDDQMRSAIWLVLMGSLLALGSTVFLLNAGMNQGRRIFALVYDSLDLDLALADIRRTVLQPSFYALVEEHDEVTRAWQLQRQLRQEA
jgi:hypothetical protein